MRVFLYHPKPLHTYSLCSDAINMYERNTSGLWRQCTVSEDNQDGAVAWCDIFTCTITALKGWSTSSPGLLVVPISARLKPRALIIGQLVSDDPTSTQLQPLLAWSLQTTISIVYYFPLLLNGMFA